MDIRRVVEPLHRLQEDEQCYHDEEEGVNEPTQHLYASVTIRIVLVATPSCHAGGYQTHHLNSSGLEWIKCELARIAWYTNAEQSNSMWKPSEIRPRLLVRKP